MIYRMRSDHRITDALARPSLHWLPVAGPPVWNALPRRGDDISIVTIELLSAINRHILTSSSEVSSLTIHQPLTV